MSAHGAEMLYGVFEENLRNRVMVERQAFRNETDRFSTPSERRRTSISADYPRVPAAEWLYDSVSSLFTQFNREYRFDLSGGVETPIRIMKYGPGGCIDWHIDDTNGSDKGPEVVRKLSMSIQLSGAEDYVGGDLEFASVPTDSFSRIAGTAICFPSYCVHRVTPVTSGERMSVLCFALGPPFR